MLKKGSQISVPGFRLVGVDAMDDWDVQGRRPCPQLAFRIITNSKRIKQMKIIPATAYARRLGSLYLATVNSCTMCVVTECTGGAGNVTHTNNNKLFAGSWHFSCELGRSIFAQRAHFSVLGPRRHLLH